MANTKDDNNKHGSDDDEIHDVAGSSNASRAEASQVKRTQDLSDLNTTRNYGPRGREDGGAGEEEYVGSLRDDVDNEEKL